VLLITEFLPEDISRSLKDLDLIVRSPTSIPEIPNVLNQTLLAGGKRLRPMLCFLMGKILGVSAEKMATFARSAEFTHSASLAHDDVVDSANIRRHNATLNATTSNARAVLAGDLLLARVMVELSQMGNVQIISDLALVVEDLVNGEWLQLEARGKVDVTFEHLLDVTRRKTASLMSWCCIVPARLSHPEDLKLLESCRRFGHNLGVAFQMVDDIIDYEKSGEKDYAKDVKEGLVNFVMAELLHLNPSLSQQVSQCLGRTDFAPPWSEAQLSQAIEGVREKSEKYLVHAADEFNLVKSYCDIKSPGVSQAVESLEMLLGFLKVRQN
jgi:geranylgeranyl pyrophosphate synthase